MATTSYYYLGQPNNTTDPSQKYFGYPTQLAAYNPYNPTDTTQPLVTNKAANDQALLQNLLVDNVDRHAQSITATMVVAPGQTLFIYVGGGVAGFFDAIGVGISIDQDIAPPLRYILVPNIKGTPTGAAQPTPSTVQGSMAIPIPLGLTPPTVFVPGTTADPNGVKIADPTALTYINNLQQAVYANVFFMSNSWTQPSSPFGWYANINAPTFWMNTNFNPDAKLNHVLREASSQINEADVINHPEYNISQRSLALGMEDLPRNVVVNPTTANQDFNDIVFEAIWLILQGRTDNGGGLVFDTGNQGP